MKTKIAILSFTILFVCNAATAQPVPRAVLAEHFTNTLCSVCASRNPGLLTNLANHPQVLHLSYYPSAPYAACPLNSYNKPEADARTNFYGVYGGTPQLLLNGTHILTPFTDPTLFTSVSGQTTPFDVRVSLTQPATDSMLVTVVVKKVDASALTSLQLYGAVAEDTLSFAAGNGETMHTDVFRKSLWGTTSLSITAPAAVGDSLVYTKMMAIDPLWARSRVYAIAILQRPDKQVEQAARSARALTASVPVVTCPAHSVCIYPNPATDRLYVGGSYGEATARIFDERGAMKKLVHINKQVQFIDISTLRAGLYFFVLNEGNHVVRERFVKN